MPAMPAGKVYSPAPKGADPFGNYTTDANGLTKREHFAGLAMASLINQYNPYEEGCFDSSDYNALAKNAVGMASALLAELDRE